MLSLNRLLKFLLWSGNRLLVLENYKKSAKVTNFVSEVIKHVENYPDFEKLAHII